MKGFLSRLAAAIRPEHSAHMTAEALAPVILRATQHATEQVTKLLPDEAAAIDPSKVQAIRDYMLCVSLHLAARTLRPLLPTAVRQHFADSLELRVLRTLAAEDSLPELRFHSLGALVEEADRQLAAYPLSSEQDLAVMCNAVGGMIAARVGAASHPAGFHFMAGEYAFDCVNEIVDHGRAILA